MKNAFKTAIKAGVLAAALTLAQASHATSIEAASSTPYLGNSTILGQVGFYDVQPWTVHEDGGFNFLAFCIDPATPADPFVNDYTKLTGFTPLDSVKQLYQSAYSQVISGGYNDIKAASFQLALWSIIAPSQMDLVATGNGFPGNNAMIQDAINMVSVAQSWNLTDGPQYTYTVYQSDNSQMVMSAAIAAVPEADTWAMLAAGLGLVGFMGRRKSNKKAQSAAA
jgi:hypothetical protein